MKKSIREFLELNTRLTHTKVTYLYLLSKPTIPQPSINQNS